ncbi:MAG: SRPBCC family protein [Flavobacteriaceae bacterium]|nr:SRPBCC family protein [Flavobacteriaceae bacterium]
MKAIKIILGFITVIVLVFFATGVIVKETNYEASVSINKPIETVFREFNNMNSKQQWMPEIKSIDTIQSNYVKTGSIYKIVIDNNGEDINMTEKVMVFIPNEKVTLFYNAENILKTNDFIFLEEGNKTTIKLNASCTSDSYVMSCLFPYFKSTLEGQDQQYLNNFKALLEEN